MYGMMPHWTNKLTRSMKYVMYLHQHNDELGVDQKHQLIEGLDTYRCLGQDIALGCSCTRHDAAYGLVNRM